jgi:hypothetical protein
MPGTRAFLILLLISLPVLLFSQEEGSEEEILPDRDIYYADLYTSGDQTFVISLGTVFPVVFFNKGKVIEHNFSPPVGGAGSLAYNYYFNSNFFVGGEIGGMFIPTLANSMAFIIPLGIRSGFQFYIWRLEFPLYASIGVSWHRYLNVGYFGMYLKGGASAYFKFNSDWSFGLNTAWYWLPEWTNNSNKDVYGNVIELTLSARYHF